MPRHAIRDYDTSFFHVMVQGINKTHIFKDNSEKDNYLNIMYKYIPIYNIKIIAYCIMDNHAHMLIYIEKIAQLSDFMKAVNTTFALYYNKKHKRNGFVFRDRYKSEPIYDESYLNNCIHYIHNNPYKAGICSSSDYYYSSYREYIYNTGKIIKLSKTIHPEINNLFISNINSENYTEYEFIDYVQDKDFLNPDKILEEFILSNSTTLEKIRENKTFLKEISLKLNKDCGLTHNEISKMFGLNRVFITRLMQNKK